MRVLRELALLAQHLHPRKMYLEQRFAALTFVKIAAPQHDTGLTMTCRFRGSPFVFAVSVQEQARSDRCQRSRFVHLPSRSRDSAPVPTKAWGSRWAFAGKHSIRGCSIRALFNK